MKHSVSLSLVGSALFLALAASSGHAAVAGLQVAAPSAAHASVVTKAGWRWHRHRHCWWRHGHRHCRW
jgi:hypothetical protein